ncbi:hypothetical protein PHSY_002680 [Pseudozyma hubeiensis SY62]|uniref:Uncharacterized protein n=1 Tax=Pseudozyma hubeiensis (strain SY62) TaxID=1305764 RepID=R9PAH6_PSEHS|nr:hypothetical protein PHSY_002680 [Pseudozyma hubeiensis SY62]GAC95105.1 hypothetical protein PHSY_002680 [Pseudozyma hubeiensis SY62]
MTCNVTLSPCPVERLVPREFVRPKQEKSTRCSTLTASSFSDCYYNSLTLHSTRFEQRSLDSNSTVNADLDFRQCRSTRSLRQGSTTIDEVSQFDTTLCGPSARAAMSGHAPWMHVDCVGISPAAARK